MTAPPHRAPAIGGWRSLRARPTPPPGLSWYDIAFVVAALTAFVLVVYLARHMTFFNDEWPFVQQHADFSIDRLMRPHNEHWSFFLVVVYTALLSIFGLSTYLPYLAVLALLHVAVAAGVYRLLSGLTAAPVALGCGLLMLFLGSGYENLSWAFQIGFVGSAAAGAWALALLAGGWSLRRHVVAAVLLSIAVATQGVGLFFLAACVVYLVARGSSRRLMVAACGPPVVLYAVWYAAFGSGSVGAHRDPYTIEALANLPAYVLSGGGGAIGAVTGLGSEVGTVLFVLMVGATAWSVLRGQPVPTVALAAVAGLLAELALIGLVRGQFGIEQARSSRYVYISAIFLLLAFGAWLGQPPVGLRWRWASSAVLVPLVLFALITNAIVFSEESEFFRERADETRVIAQFVEADASWIDHDQSSLGFGIPGPRELRLILDRYGSPARDVLAPSLVQPAPPEAVDRAIRRLVGSQFRVEAVSEDTGDRVVDLVGVHDMSIAAADGCVMFRDAGPDPWVSVEVDGLQNVAFRAGNWGVAQVFLALNSGPQDRAAFHFDVEPDGIYLIHTPPSPDDRPWLIRLDPPVGEGRLC